MNNHYLDNQNQRRFTYIICLACFLTNISQMPYLVERSLSRYIAIPVWIALAVLCIVKRHIIQINLIMKIVLMITGFFGFYYGIARIFNSDFSKSSLPYVIFLSIFVFIVGSMAGKLIDEKSMESISTAYIISGLLVCINIYTFYIRGNSLIGSVYLYSSKNSVAQILLTTWILVLLFKFNNKRAIKKVCYVACFIFLTWVMLALKSRATIIGMPIVLVWVIIHGKMNRKARNATLFMIVFVGILLMDDSIYNFVVNQILFGGRDASNLNSLSSGRAEEWASFWQDFLQGSIWGEGDAKRESIVLTSFLQFGMIGGLSILILAVTPLLWGIIGVQEKDTVYLTFTSIALAYIVNGIFEQLAPFGPGVKCYLLWFMFGLLSNMQNKKGLDKKYG